MSMFLNILKSYAIFTLVVLLQVLQNTSIRFKSVVCGKALCIVFGQKIPKGQFYFIQYFLQQINISIFYVLY